MSRRGQTGPDLDTVRALLTRSLSGDYIEHERVGSALSDALAGLAESLGLPEVYSVADVDQAIARLKEAARA